MLQCVTQPTGLASLNRDTGTVLYGRGQLGSIWVKTRRLPAISDHAVLFINESIQALAQCRLCFHKGFNKKLSKLFRKIYSAIWLDTSPKKIRQNCYVFLMWKSGYFRWKVEYREQEFSRWSYFENFAKGKMLKLSIISRNTCISQNQMFSSRNFKCSFH